MMDCGYDFPDGCTCHIWEDLDWGEILTQPPDGCPVHVHHQLSCQINKPVPPGYPWPTFSCNCNCGDTATVQDDGRITCPLHEANQRLVARAAAREVGVGGGVSDGKLGTSDDPAP